MSGTKKCPACAEEIKKEAKKCRFCWENIEIGNEFENLLNEKGNLNTSKLNKDSWILKFAWYFFWTLLIITSFFSLINWEWLFWVFLFWIWLLPPVINKIRQKIKNKNSFWLKYWAMLFLLFFIVTIFEWINNTNNEIKKISWTVESIPITNIQIETKKDEITKKQNELINKKIIKQNEYIKVEINKLSNELYLKFKNNEIVDRDYYYRHIIQWEWEIVDLKYSWKAAMVLFNLNKKSTLDDDLFNNPYIVKIKWEYPLWFKKWDKVKFSGAVWRLWWTHNSTWWNRSWAIYLDDLLNKDYTYIKKIY